MRLVLPILAAALVACQPDTPANGEAASSNTATSDENQMAMPPISPADPDTPVSSNDTPVLPPDSVGNDRDCPIIRSSDWHAHVDAMPGPNAHPRLNVSGKVTVPTGGYKLDLRMGPVAESYPVQVTVYLDAVPPKGMATQALETREVQGSWRSEERVGSVTVRCGRQVLARLSDIETAL